MPRSPSPQGSSSDENRASKQQTAQQLFRKDSNAQGGIRRPNGNGDSNQPPPQEIYDKGSNAQGRSSKGNGA
ncbi:hypothetical protein M0R45_015622 [Rubus argutus]|uniref:Uncharacterized protein n=1 Tax=Rubus argutus TaxID=59490 RepID=A0AAW1XPT5_RUBAR